MWGSASNAIAGCFGPKNTHKKQIQPDSDCSDDETSCVSHEEGLECPICFESFNVVENVPYVLWCGHTLCKNCVLGLQWAVVKFPTVPVQLPLFISCPWCQLLSFRLVYKGVLKFPRKNFFLLWMVESMNGDRRKSNSCSSRERGNHNHTSRRMQHQTSSNISSSENSMTANHISREFVQASLRRLFTLFANLTAKFPLVIIFLLMVVYAIPASAVVLILYVLVTVLFALPSFLILYFAYPSLDWLVREILT